MADVVPNDSIDDSNRNEAKPEVATKNGGGGEGSQNEATPEVGEGNGKQDTTPLPTCSPRYHSTIFPHAVKSGRAYASNMVSSQKTMLEHLRYVRAQLEREERQMQIMQAQISYRKEIRGMPDKYDVYIRRRRDDEEE